MRLLHTADWHLGQTLHGQSRAEEQALALDWLLATCEERAVDCLIVAGDIFDVASPAEEARRLYYDFLARLARGPLKWVVVVAGNHDSPRMVSAAKSLAAAMGIHVVAEPATDPADDLLELRDPDTGELAAVVAGIPFLHDRHVRRSRAGASAADRDADLAAGIHRHFDGMAAGCADHVGAVPVVATGHLYATGASARDGQDNIYVGNVRNLDAGRLPAAFDYVALGHIHRAQALRGAEHVRYSGSLIPLDFQECTDEKGVWCVDLAAGRPPEIEYLASPVNRRLKQISGGYEAVAQRLTDFCARHAEDALPPWIEVVLDGGYVDEAQRTALREIAEPSGARILKFTRRRAKPSEGGRAAAAPAPERLDELTVEEVFERRCAPAELDVAARARVGRLFAQVLADARAGKTEVAA